MSDSKNPQQPRNLSDIRSTLNERLHPRIDPTDQYDSLSARFQSRLRHLPEPQPLPEFVDRGKRFNVEKRQHNPIVDTQLHHMQPREDKILNSSLSTTRFHHGFNRSCAAHKEFYNRVESAREVQATKREEGISHDRDVFMARRPEYKLYVNETNNNNNNNNNDSSSQHQHKSVAFNLGPATSTFNLAPIQPMVPKSEARKLRLAQESRSPFDPPPPPSILRNVSARRKEQVANEGLTETRKLLNVGNTIGGAMDGFVHSKLLPAISEQRRGRVIQGNQMKSTFTLG